MTDKTDKTCGMTYSVHLLALIDAYKAAVPLASDRSLSLQAGLGHSWVSDFRRTQQATFQSAEKLARVIQISCPQGHPGDRVRDLIEMIKHKAHAGAA